MAATEQLAEVLADLEWKGRRERARLAARSPKRLARVVAEVVRRRGYACVQTEEELAGAWRQAVGELDGGPSMVQRSRPGKLRRGVLEVWVASSVVNQELTLHKRAILTRLHALAPDRAVRDLRIRVGSVL